MKNKNYIAVHLLNDFSGSPLVLSNCIDALTSDGCEVELLTNGTEGFLSRCKCTFSEIFYRRFNNKILTLFSFLLSQIILFFIIFFKIKNNKEKEKPTVIVNTILPFGAAIAARLMGAHLIYYVHESSIRPFILKKFLKFVLKKTANEAIYVSYYLKNIEGFNDQTRIIEHVIYNSLPSSLDAQIPLFEKSEFIIFMAASLKGYKGVYEFVELANRLSSSSCKFVLALNADELEFSKFINANSNNSNLQIVRRPQDINAIYRRSSLVLNLSKENEWIETFGMTIIEGFSYGCPAIVPPIGGIAEIVEEGYNGFKMSVSNLTLIESKIMELYTDKATYDALSTNAFNSTDKYLFNSYREKITGLF
jgi:glycosyltransferase involved in cell wall biosynthesis